MGNIIGKLRSSPTAARVAPFIVFAALTSLQGQFGEEAKYWFYVARTLVGAWMVWVVRPVVQELQWKVSIHGVLVGIGIAVIWIGLDSLYPKFISAGKVWNPHLQYGQGSSLAWFFVMVRILGSSIVVPPLEEMFYRSFVYRYLVNPDFEKAPLGKVNGMSFTITSVVFGIMHREWLAGIICGAAYQWLAVRKGHLGDAIIAHGITNFLLGLWVVYKGAWGFW